MDETTPLDFFERVVPQARDVERGSPEYIQLFHNFIADQNRLRRLSRETVVPETLLSRAEIRILQNIMDDLEEDYVIERAIVERETQPRPRRPPPPPPPRDTQRDVILEQPGGETAYGLYEGGGRFRVQQSRPDVGSINFPPEE